MIKVSYTEFDKNFKILLDAVESDDETIIIKGGRRKGTVLMPLDKYNSLMETFHLLGSKANADRLYESIEQMKSSRGIENNLI